MQTGDRFRLLRGFGLAAGALLLVSGAVFASQAGLPTDAAGDRTDASDSAEASVGPCASP